MPFTLSCQMSHITVRRQIYPPSSDSYPDGTLVRSARVARLCAHTEARPQRQEASSQSGRPRRVAQGHTADRQSGLQAWRAFWPERKRPAGQACERASVRGLAPFGQQATNRIRGTARVRRVRLWAEQSLGRSSRTHRDLDRPAGRRPDGTFEGSEVCSVKKRRTTRSAFKAVFGQSFSAATSEAVNGRRVGRRVVEERRRRISKPLSQIAGWTDRAYGSRPCARKRPKCNRSSRSLVSVAVPRTVSHDRTVLPVVRLPRGNR